MGAAHGTIGRPNRRIYRRRIEFHFPTARLTRPTKSGREVYRKNVDVARVSISRLRLIMGGWAQEASRLAIRSIARTWHLIFRRSLLGDWREEVV